MCLRVHQFAVGDIAHFKFHCSHKECEFVFLTDPADWEAIPYIATRLPHHGIVMRQTGQALPLIRHALCQQENALTEDDINKCAKILKLAQSDTLKGNFAAIAKHFCGAS